MSNMPIMKEWLLNSIQEVFPQKTDSGHFLWWFVNAVKKSSYQLTATYGLQNTFMAAINAQINKAAYHITLRMYQY